MKKRVAVLVAAFLLLISTLLSPLTAAASYSLPADKTTTSSSAVVVFLGSDMNHDMVMYEQNPDEPHAPAGMVRVMVGLYALKTMEEQNIEPAIATGTYTEAVFDEITGTGLYTIGMEYGDVWRVEDLLNITVIQTAADAAMTLVMTLAGTEERFVEGMNALATEIGCTNTHFSNVLGLDDPEQYTTARDMYRILRYAALNYPEMMTMLGQSSYTVHPVSGESDSWPTTNDMLRQNSAFYYTPLVYGRSGYTESEGQSCASVARDDGIEFMTVVMGCRDAEGSEGLAFLDTMTLFRWVYNAFSYKTIVSKNQPVSRIGVKLAWSTDSVALVAGESLEGMLKNETDVNTLRYEITLNEDTLTAPVEKGQVAGTATVYDGDEAVGVINLCAAEAIGRSQLLAIFDAVWRVLTSPVMLIVFALLIALLIAYIAMSVIHNQNRRRKKQQRVKHFR